MGSSRIIFVKRLNSSTFTDVVALVYYQVGQQQNWWRHTRKADNNFRYRGIKPTRKRPFLIALFGRAQKTTEEKEKTSKSNYHSRATSSRFAVVMIWTSQRMRFKPCSSYKNNVLIVGLAPVLKFKILNNEERRLWNSFYSFPKFLPVCTSTLKTKIRGCNKREKHFRS